MSGQPSQRKAWSTQKQYCRQQLSEDSAAVAHTFGERIRQGPKLGEKTGPLEFWALKKGRSKRRVATHGYRADQHPQEDHGHKDENTGGHLFHEPDQNYIPRYPISAGALQRLPGAASYRYIRKGPGASVALLVGCTPCPSRGRNPEEI